MLPCTHDSNCQHNCPLVDVGTIQRIFDGLSNTTESLTDLNREVGRVVEKVDTISKVLLPNGHPGFIKDTKTRLTFLETTATDLLAAKKVRTHIWLAASSILASIGTLVGIAYSVSRWMSVVAVVPHLK